MNKNSESFNIARHQYIKGYQDKNEHIFPTLDLVAKEFSLTLYLRYVRKLLMKVGIKKENNIKMLEKNMKCVNNLKVSIQN